jgi:pimeloyl-ACP methyl ester carboxylesterase
MLREQEIEAAGDLAGGALGGTSSLVGELHEAIAGRTFRALGPMAAPVRAIHDGVSAAVYRAVSIALGSVPRAGAAVLARATPVDAPSVSDSLRGSLALGALNGAIGDRLADGRSPLALEMTFRDAPSPSEATPLLAVFVHGLSETDEAWRLRRPSYGELLREQLGYTPLHLRYNTGLHISDNGRRLSQLLDELVAEWPLPVDEIALVGHSMGGLVARSACHYGQADGARWTQSLRHVFCLGSPHLGAPLEKAANVAGYALARLPETQPLAKLVNGRSVGIKDLRFGSCVEEDWCDCDADEFLRDRCHEVPFVETATYYFVGATLSRGPDHRIGSLVGDLLVRYPSASGQGRRRRIPFEIDNGRHLGGLNHFQLLNHPAVYELLRGWLAWPPRLEQGAE